AHQTHTTYRPLPAHPGPQALKTDFAILKHDVQNLRERTGETERRISDLEDNTAPLPGRLTATEKQIAILEAKADDLENRLRRNNIRLGNAIKRRLGLDFIRRTNPQIVMLQETHLMRSKI
uniref:Uncharacterized protein n=1 Tax=Xenopus tropicalis TaxID=8364 RepID=A0A803J3H2_XENTR